MNHESLHYVMRPSILTIVVIGALCFLGAAAIMTLSHHVPQPSPIAEIMGQHGDFVIDGGSHDQVFARIATNDPDRYIKALQDVRKLVEETDGRKVVDLRVAGSPPVAYLTLEKR